jgi:hypothetical protein
MKNLKLINLALILVLASCKPAAETEMPPAVTETASAPVATNAPGLTEESLKDGEYIIVEDDQPYLVRLMDGRYQYGTDPTAEDYTSISLADVFAFGDLNGDGAQDAVALLVETYGGTGVFVSLVAVVDDGGVPKHISSAFIDDRPVIYTLAVQDGEILMNVVVHAPDDAMCCPSLAEERTYRLGPRGLILTRLTSETEGSTKRIITIESPSEGSEVGRVFPVKGSVTIAPFENNLVVKVFDAGENQIYIGPLAVDAPDMGAPGTFDVSINLEGIDIDPGPIRIEMSDVSMADGSYLAMASVVVALK